MCDADGRQLPKTTSNVARNAYRMIRRAGLAWKIHIETIDFEKPDGSFLEMHYLKPTAILEYFVAHCPMLVCGAKDVLEMQTSCAAFWKAYKKYHGGHEVFSVHGENNWSHIIPLALHGDEGKGKRRSNTTVVALEAVIGCKGQTDSCSCCQPSCIDVSLWGPRGDGEHLLAKHQRTNMKSHSYLQHWPLFIVPGTLHKEYKPLTHFLMDAIATDLVQLFQTGIQAHGTTWFGAVIGAKGDLKWHSKIGRFQRGFEHMGRIRDIPCCHCCLGGARGLPAEDIATDHPCWETSMWSTRPWAANNPPSLQIVPFDSRGPEKLYRHDPFHTLKLGLYRDFVASVIFLFMRWGFFGGGAVPVKLETAHSHFRLWCLAQRKTASLRSFSKAFFNYTSTSSYPWANAKGSDVTLMMKWLRTATCAFLSDCSDHEKVEVLKTIWSAANLAVQFFDHMNGHCLWLSTSCGAVLYEYGHSFLIGYTWLAGYAHRSQMCLFSVKPKAHFFRHILLDLRLQLEKNDRVILNPLCWNCEQNEDFIGRMSALTIKLDSRVATHRVLEFWMVKASILFKRHFPKEYLELSRTRRGWCDLM